jgi:uncharacterized cupredoxin-like copper-binding protein
MARGNAVLFAGLLALLAGCATTTPATGPLSVRVAMEEMRFAPNRIDVHVGQPLTIQVVNQGSQAHDMTFPSLHMPGLEGQERTLAPGETGTLSLVFDQPGTHTFVCSIPGHAAMTGAVFVSP